MTTIIPGGNIIGVHTTRVVFERVRTRRTKRGACSECGRETSRTRVFEHTVNPFNRNAGGEPKTREEVSVAVNAEADSWMPDFRHGKCRG